jgi:superfamily II DNA/RNA helicase
MGILEECLSDPEQKIVVFSQWERMTRLVALGLDERKIGYRSLSGSVPSAKRAQLFDTFNGNRECRVFLSTDAGSTGLNLQSASILINLDLPWNPAVREQRIGRIHRIGQKHSITVLDLVSVDTIESRMLDVLSFKSDLARGILDFGEDSIFLGEDKYRHFMNAVSEVVAPEGSESAPASLAANDEDEGETSELAESRPDSTPSASPDPGELLSRGVSFLSDLSQALSEPGGAERLVAAISDTDPKTGRMYLKIPIEDSASAIGAITALASFFSAISAKARNGSGS